MHPDSGQGTPGCTTVTEILPPPENSESNQEDAPALPPKAQDAKTQEEGAKHGVKAQGGTGDWKQYLDAE